LVAFPKNTAETNQRYYVASEKSGVYESQANVPLT
jgi:hypothetical protein